MLKKILKSNFVTNVLIALILIYFKLIKYFCKTELRMSEGVRKIVANNSPCICMCWHSRFMLFLPLQQFGSIQALTSVHHDGNYISKILKVFNHRPIRGSSRKNGARAIREILELEKENIKLVFASDGPIGPRYQVKENIIKLAKKLDLPIIPICYSSSNAKVLNTWDQFIIPIPFGSKIILEFGTPLQPKKLSLNKLENLMLNQMKRLDTELNLKIDY